MTTAAVADPPSQRTPTVRQRFGLTANPWLTWAFPALLTTAICLYGAWRPALWTDELATWSAARRPWDQLFDLLGNVDAALGLYYAFMHVWITIFGDSALAMRMPSILGMGMAAGMLAALGRSLFSAKVGLTAGVLFAFVPSVTRFGQEARVYALVLALAVGATLLLISALNRGGWRWFAYSAVVAVLVASHTLALLLLLAHALEVARRAWAGTKRALLNWVVAVAGGLLIAAPAVLWGYSQREQVAWNARPRLLALTELPGEWFSAPVIGGFLLGIGLVAVLLGRLGPSTALIVAWAGIPPVLLFIAGRMTPVWNPRYVLFAMPAVVLAAAVAVAQLPWRRLTIAGLVVALLVAPQQQELRKADAHAQMDGRAVADIVAPNFNEGDVFAFPYNEVWAGQDTVRYYLEPRLGPTTNIFATDTPEGAGELLSPECATKAGCRRMVQESGAERVWMVRWGNWVGHAWDGIEEPKRAVLREYFHVDQEWLTSNMTVVLLSRR